MFLGDLDVVVVYSCVVVVGREFVIEVFFELVEIQYLCDVKGVVIFEFLVVDVF